MEIFTNTDIALWNPMRTGGRFVFNLLRQHFGQAQEHHDHVFDPSQAKDPQRIVVTVRNPFTRWRSYQRWATLYPAPQPRLPAICYKPKITQFQFYDVIRLETVAADLQRIFGITTTDTGQAYKMPGVDYDDVGFFRDRPEVVQKIRRDYVADFVKFDYSMQIGDMYR